MAVCFHLQKANLIQLFDFLFEKSLLIRVRLEMIGGSGSGNWRGAEKEPSLGNVGTFSAFLLTPDPPSIIASGH